MRKKWIPTLLLVLSLTVQLTGQTVEHDRYIERFKAIAILEMERANIPASIKLAQGILESGIGKSELSRNANNHFGIKCGGNWQGDTYYIIDDDKDENGNLIKSCFRVFTTAEESYIAHTEFLLDPKKRNRYGFLFNFDPKKDYEEWAKGLKQAGYATNPRYPELLLGIIEKNNLHQYDLMTSADLDPKLVESYPGKRDEISTGQTNKYSTVFHHNRVRTVFAKAGDSPADIAFRFGYSVRKVLKYNEIEGTRFFEENERVYLQRKKCRYKGNKREHLVKQGENMYLIAQLYGVRLKSLYRKNKIDEGREPMPGEKIALYKRTKNIPRLYPVGATPENTTPQPPTTKPEVNETPVEDGRLGEIVAPTPKPTTTPPSGQLLHTVQKGETLYRISKMYNVSVDEIKKLNNLTSTNLEIGQQLLIKK